MRGVPSYTVFSTSLGWLGMLASPYGLLRTTLPHSTPEEAFRALGEEAKGAECLPEHFAGLIVDLRLYFSGRKASFPVRVDLYSGTDFQRLVWETTRMIPYGQTRSYGWVAMRLGRPAAPRAVGQALGRNPLPIIIPCHRVLASDGALCGFTGGIDIKLQLLRLEGILSP